MKKSEVSVFDYPITIQRKHRYLVVSCSEFGLNIGSECLILGKLSPQELGTSVLRIFERIQSELMAIRRSGGVLPSPGVLHGTRRHALGTGDAAKALGLSRATLQRFAKVGVIRALRTPGGHYRFSPESLAQFLTQIDESGGLARLSQVRPSGAA